MTGATHPAVAGAAAPERYPRVLCVDDEPQVLVGLRRILGSTCAVETAEGGAAALELIATRPPFEVVISDMRMPRMNGATFLRAVREQSPDTVRVLLTGYAELDAAISAVNEANIFRFLCKPCPPETLLAMLGDALEQHRLVVAERELLEQTVNGSIQALLATLALADPESFAQAARVQRLVGEMADECGLSDRWSLVVAAGLSQLGIVSLPADTLHRFREGRRLHDDEQVMVDRLPQIADDVLARIPRLEPVRETLQAQGWLVSADHAPPRPATDALRRALMVQIAYHFDALRRQDRARSEAFAELRSEWTDASDAIDALERVVASRAALVPKSISAKQLRPGMVIARDVLTHHEVLLVGEGQEVTTGLIARIENHAAHIGVREPIEVLVPIDE